MNVTQVPPMKPLTIPFGGIFVPNMVPLDAEQKINEGELRRYIEWLISSGVHGLYPNGSTGEFTRFTPDERGQIVSIVCDQANGRVPVLAGAAEANVRETLRACENYQAHGARAVAIISPFYYRLGPSAVFAYFREIAINSPIDVTLYNIPLFASPIDVTTVQRLAEFPRIIGIKDSSGDISHMIRMMAAVEPIRPDFIFLTGWEPAVVPMLAMGCHGGTLAMSGVVPEVTRRIYELVMAGKLPEARKWQMRLTQFFDRVFGEDFPEGVRAAIEARGFTFGRSRQPLGQRDMHVRAELKTAIDTLLAS
jgi:dihydrodipicolinate synthase/N-acetylneuraminate lyase